VNPPFSTFRIERVAPDRLRLFHGDKLVDEDVEAEGDTLDVIEYWGSGVAWAENYTSIARWDAEPAGDNWQTLTGVPYRYARRQLDDRTVWDEIGPDGAVTRRVEADPDGRYLAAASSPAAEPGPDAEPTDGLEFVKRWMAARQALDPAGGARVG
jgi:hypothetical protein